jgi:hypothetical protein
MRARLRGGGELSRHLRGWEVISWALVLALPLMLAVSLLTCPASLTTAALNRMLGFEARTMSVSLK